MLHHGTILVLCTLIFLATSANAQGLAKRLHVHADLPVSKEDKLLLDVFYNVDSSIKGQFAISFYKFTNQDDSLLVARSFNPSLFFKKNGGKIKVNFNLPDSGNFVHQKFQEIVKRTGNIPPGSYKAILTVISSYDTICRTYLHQVDSLLKKSSPIHQQITESIAPKQKTFAGLLLKNAVSKSVSSTGGSKNIELLSKRATKAVRRRGLTAVNVEKRNKNYLELYYEDWFAGMCEIQQKQSSNKLVNTPAMDVSNDLGSPSLFSQYRKNNQDNQDKEESKGDIGLSTNLATGQEQHSGISNNYYELRGNLETYISGIPIEIEALYTSQDNNRQVKSSYFRVHYNVDKMKEGLDKSIRSYNGKFAETKSKGVGMQQIYKSAINNMEMQKSNLLIDITRMGHVDNKVAVPEYQLQDNVSKDGSEDSIKVLRSLNAGNLQGSVTAKEGDIEKKRKQVDELDRKITKYKTLLDQFENTNYFDSLVGYSKTKDADQFDNLSYKQLAKKGSNLLPDGKAKKFIAGLTSLDAGMFSKDESAYTMSGQMVKGLDVGYDLGFCEVAGTVGKTEYIGRDGSLDRYTCYSERTTLKLSKKQKVSAIYYGYSPDRKVFSDGFFKNTGITAPGFSQPVHIFSANYSGTVTRYVTAGAEVAASFKQSDHTNNPKPALQDRMAYNVHAEASIPHTNVTMESSFDKTGGNFENNTLPISYRGTERYRIGAKSEFFRSRVVAGIEYNRLLQSYFSGSGNITRWGFDIKTNFKQYPNVAVSYKPFSSFHSAADTLNVPQRQLLGSVWTAKATYQYRVHDRSWRFMLLYNDCRTDIDTLHYHSSLSQVTAIFSNKLIAVTGSLGHSSVASIDTSLSMMPRHTTFISFSGSYVISKKATISTGQDLGTASFGLCRYAATIGYMYRMEKIPLTVRLNTRYNTYVLDASTPWRKLYSCSIDMVYRFKMRSAKNNH